jgi:glycosyltransferase involved in cell wall biosynthesis
MEGKKAVIRLSILITVYSEETALQETIQRLLLNDRGYIHEIILMVSPLSSARCLEICRALIADNSRVRLLLQQQPGVGHAVREGMAAAAGNHVAIMSADLETEPEAVDRMVRKIEQTGCQAVFANRWMENGGFQNYHPLKLILNWLFQNIFKRLYATEIGDLTFGFKILRKDLIDAISWEGTRHEIFIETTLKPLLLNASINQVPTVWKGRMEGVSKNNFFINCRYVWLAVRLTRYIPARLKKIHRNSRQIQAHRRQGRHEI